MASHPYGPRDLTLRILLAVLGGYGLALNFVAFGTALVTHQVGVPRADAFISMAMVGFLVWVLAALSAFAISSLLRASLSILTPTAALGLLAWLLSPLPAPAGG